MEKSSNIRLIILKNFEKRGNEIALQIEEKYGKIEDLIVPLQQPRFSNGEGKVLLEETVRQKNVFILSDVGNYG